MNETKKNISLRWFYLAVGVIAMLFAGVLYAWSILKAPLAEELKWDGPQLALNFTIAMGFFGIGGLVGARISKRAGHRAALLISGALSATGFILTAFLYNAPVILLYITYGVLAGLGIGIAYNVVIATVSSWFPDKKGLCSGFLMMGFGASALVLGNAADALFKSSLGWRNTYMILGAAICAVIALSALLLKKPDNDTVFPEVKKTKSTETESFEKRDFTSAEMLSRPSFWMAFAFISFLAAVGSSAISFAKDLALSTGAPDSLAVTLVGVLSVCNGIGRILTGALFDSIGRRKTMLFANGITILSAAVTLIAVSFGSLPLCIAGLCLIGMSYGACPTITAAFTSSFYGMKYFPTNMAFMTFTVLGGSLVATVSNTVLKMTGGYVAPFGMLLGLTLIALILNLFIKKP